MRLHMLLRSRLRPRRVQVLGVTPHPAGEWVAQQARNLLMQLGEHVSGFRFLVRDRDAKLTAAFDAVFAAAGIQVLRTPVKAPEANAYAQRWSARSGGRCWIGCSSWGRQQLVPVLAGTPTITTCIPGTVAWDRHRDSGVASQLSSCRLRGSCAEIDLVD